MVKRWSREARAHLVSCAMSVLEAKLLVPIGGINRPPLAKATQHPQDSCEQEC